MGYSGMQYWGEHPSTAGVKQQMASQQMYANAVANQNREDGRELFERGLLQQEQNRRSYDSATQRQGQQQKFGVLSGLLGGTRRIG